MWATTGCGFDTSGLAGGAAADASAADARTRSDATAGPDAHVAPDAQTASALGHLMTPRTAIAPLLDGKPLGPWATADFLHFAIGDAMLTTDVQPAYGYDAAVDIATLHDDDRIYFFLEVTDSKLVADSASPRDDDGVALYVDGDGSGSGAYGGDDHAVVVTVDATFADYGEGGAVVDGTRLLTATGYDLELSITKASLGVTADGTIGFDLALIDDDDLGGTGRDAYGLWYVPAGAHCTSCCASASSAWCDSTMFGALTLED